MVFFTSSNWKSFIDLLTSISTLFDETPLKIANIPKCSLIFKSLNNTSCWGQIPIFVLKSSIFSGSNTFILSYNASPSVASYRPVNIEIKVVLPAPL